VSSMNCENWEQLTNAAQQKCIQIVDKKIAPIAKEIVLKHIVSDIYGAYTPKENGWVTKNGSRTTYRRRHLLDSKGNIYHEFISGDEIIITSRVTASPAIAKGWSFHNRYPGAFLKLLESGNMGLWRGGFARPAIGNAQKEINTSSRINDLIRLELNK